MTYSFQIKFIKDNIPEVDFSFYVLFHVLPGTFLFVGANLLAFKLLALIGLEMADVTKGLTLLITAVMQQLILNKSTPSLSWIGILIISSSFFLALFTIPPLSLLYGTIAASFSAGRSVISPRQMKHVDHKGGVMSFYNSITGVMLIPIYIYIFEFDPVNGRWVTGLCHTEIPGPSSTSVATPILFPSRL